MKKSRLLWLALGWLLWLMPLTTLADSDNIFVEDNASILNAEQKASIKEMNEVTFKQLEGTPQYAVVTLPNLDDADSIEDYAVHKFEQLGVGQRDLDNGFLFVIAIEDHEYRLEVGYGVEDVITDSMKDEIVDGQATELLQDEQYGEAVMRISKNVEKVVVERYGNYEASKQAVIAEKEQQAAMYRGLGWFAAGLLSLTTLGGVLYKLKLWRLTKKISQQLIDQKVRGYQFKPVRQFASLTVSNSQQSVNFAEQYAKKSLREHRSLDSLAPVLAEDLVEDAVIQYQQTHRDNNHYEVAIYLEGESFINLKATLVEEFSRFARPLTANPYVFGEYGQYVADYVEQRTVEHARLMAISDLNKQTVETVSERYAAHTGLLNGSALDNDLLIALMVYRLLEGHNLADEQLVAQLDLSEQSLAGASRYAEQKRKKIAKDKRRTALDDLSHMTLGDYYLQSLIWSNYASSSSSSGGFGGGGSFGGGASGGGGFSGGW
ncbi:TPM domain-containing protein [Vagococcus zengguangii]|nr:TPM domain-containing protein [Vagococcus zengguangii]